MKTIISVCAILAVVIYFYSADILVQKKVIEDFIAPNLNALFLIVLVVAAGSALLWTYHKFGTRFLEIFLLLLVLFPVYFAFF